MNNSNHVTKDLPAIPMFYQAPLVDIEQPAISKTYRVAAHKGSVDSTASKQWANRPDDQRFTDLYKLRDTVANRYRTSHELLINPNNITVNDDMSITVADTQLELTNWTFNQLARLGGIPQDYIKRLPTELAKANLEHGLQNVTHDSVNMLIDTKTKELRALNSKEYARIWDYQVIDEVIKLVGNGVDDTRWKVPGMLNWSDNNGVTVNYNPYVDVNKDTTTLYASDRDVFLFLVNDTNPIEVGTLANGEPDLMFRGFMVGNSETGASNLFISTMLMRGVCANRNAWGVEEKTDLRMRHRGDAVTRFSKDFAPFLLNYSNQATIGIVEKAKLAKSTIIAANDDEALGFLMSKAALPKTVANNVMLTSMQEEGLPIRSIWDVVQGMTAVARKIRHQDTRTDMEIKAGKFMSAL